MRISILTVLSDRVRTDTGWQRRGVRGWMLTDELAHLGLPTHLLPDLAARGLIRREDAADPIRERPQYIVRITQAGENEVAEHAGRIASTIPHRRRSLNDVDRGTIFVTAPAWNALTILVTSPPGHWVAAAAHGIRIKPQEQEFLAHRGLVEIQQPEGGGRRYPLMMRAADRGRQALAVVRAEDRVQVYVPGLRASGPE